jgi:hypothetical protein
VELIDGVAFAVDDLRLRCGTLGAVVSAAEPSPSSVPLFGSRLVGDVAVP